MVTCKIKHLQKRFRAVDFRRLCRGRKNVVKMFYFTCNHGLSDRLGAASNLVNIQYSVFSKKRFIYDDCSIRLKFFYLRRRLASRADILMLGECVSVCVSAEPRLHAALVWAAKVMRCIQCSLSYRFNY